MSDAQAQRVGQDPSVAYVAPDRSFVADGSARGAGGDRPVGIRRVRAATATVARTPTDVAVATWTPGSTSPTPI